MRQLTYNEMAKEGDFFYLYPPFNEWIRLDPKPKYLFRKTLGELDNENVLPHFPLVVLRPNQVEYLFKIWPTVVPCDHGYINWSQCEHCSQLERSHL